MSDTRLALLWHMHQPDYRHPATGAPIMPWVRLHSLRGYRDVCLDTIRDQVPVTINVVPSLLDQMLGYAEGRSDRHLELTRRPADGLPPSDVAEMLESFVAGHPAMRQAHPGYRGLEARVGSRARLDVQAIRDLQVWSTLAWFGSTALRDFPLLAELRSKGSGFTEADKEAMLSAQDAILRELPGLFGRVRRDSPAAISTSPYFHPILPLLVDSRHARRSLPHVPDDPLFAAPGDALLQLRRARERVGVVLGEEPVGLWPSEGAVSPEVVELVGQAGFRWLATDEGILHASDRDGTGHGGWDLGHGVVGFFRDQDLSDRIGFRYAGRDAEEAAEELVTVAAHRARGEVVTVALDGENPWETFADAGEAFRRALHRRLREGPVRGITLDEAARLPPVGRVRRLHTGSWIGANLDIWYGHPEDRLAWSHLGHARRAIEESPPEDRARALDRLLPAEGSDWMWWYGEEFSTPFDAVFDELFRAHVRAAWEALGKTPPSGLYQPIRTGAAPSVVPPRRRLHPRLVPDPAWIHWSGAGRVRWPPGGAMARGVVHTTGLSFGWSPSEEAHPEGCLWLRVDLPPALPEEGEGAHWLLHVAHHQLRVPYGSEGARVDQGPLGAVSGREAIVARVDARTLPRERVPLFLEVVGRHRARYPFTGTLDLARPTDLEHWSV